MQLKSITQLTGRFTAMITIAVAAIFTSQVQASDFYHLEQAVDNNQVLEIAPIFDFDGDGCFPAAGISRDGEQNGGLNPSGSLGGGCRTTDFLNYSNTLHRSQCTQKDGSEYCGHFYALYFEKDQVIAGWDLFGHRHDWEQAAVWTKDGAVTHGSVSAHGDMETRALADIPHTGTHIRVVYHKDGVSTHAMRFASSTEAAENPYYEFVTPPVTSWYQIHGDSKTNAQMRALLNSFDYGSATIPLKDSNFLDNLNRFKPASYPEFFDGED